MKNGASSICGFVDTQLGDCLQWTGSGPGAAPRSLAQSPTENDQPLLASSVFPVPATAALGEARNTDATAQDVFADSPFILVPLLIREQSGELRRKQ
jgi:hypothetical protein